jgi:hypothetical protein
MDLIGQKILPFIPQVFLKCNHSAWAKDLSQIFLFLFGLAFLIKLENHFLGKKLN